MPFTRALTLDNWPFTQIFALGSIVTAKAVPRPFVKVRLELLTFEITPEAELLSLSETSCSLVAVIDQAADCEAVPMTIILSPAWNSERLAVPSALLTRLAFEASISQLPPQLATVSVFPETETRVPSILALPFLLIVTIIGAWVVVPPVVWAKAKEVKAAAESKIPVAIVNFFIEKLIDFMCFRPFNVYMLFKPKMFHRLAAMGF